MTVALSATQRRWRHIARLWANGRTQREIADRVGLDTARVGAEVAKMRAAGWALERRNVADPAAIGRRRDRLVEMWGAGDTVTEIAAALGMGVAAAASEIARMRRKGWELPYRRAPVEHAAPVKDRIAELWADGASLPEIAAAMGLTTSNVSSRIALMRDEGGALDRRVGTGEAQARRDRIAALYRAGKGLREIAEEVGGSAASVGAIVSQMRAAGIDLPRRTRRRSDPSRNG